MNVMHNLLHSDELVISIIQAFKRLLIVELFDEDECVCIKFIMFNNYIHKQNLLYCAFIQR